MRSDEIRSIVEILNSHADLLPCGRAVIHLLGQIIAVLEDEPNVKALDRAVTIAESLLRLSNEKILSFNYRDVPTCWRRLYTDAIIFKVLAAMMAGKERMEEEWIKDLDMVIIVAGSPGEGRREIVFALIEEAQSSCRSRDDDAHRQKRRRVSTSPASPPPRSLAIPSLSADYPIPILDSLPDFESFLGASQSAFIVRQAASTWPALTDSDHRWSSFDYMRKVAGPHRVVPVEVGGNYTEESWGQKIMPFDDLLDVIDRDTGLEDRLYLAQHDLFRQLPALRNDIIVPELVYASPLSNYETYVPPASEDGYLTNAWLGPEGTVSPPHTDPYFNCYVQVVGSKWIWIAPPSVTSSMYTFSLTGNSECDEGEGEGASASSNYMTNTSRINVAASSIESLGSRFPQFVENVIPVARSAVLEPGDLLFMPPGWWHSMKSLSKSISVSIWF